MVDFLETMERVGLIVKLVNRVGDKKMKNEEGILLVDPQWQCVILERNIIYKLTFS